MRFWDSAVSHHSSSVGLYSSTVSLHGSRESFRYSMITPLVLQQDDPPRFQDEIFLMFC
jgi:hypothetical protein